MSTSKKSGRAALALANAQVDGSRIDAATVTWVKRSRYNPIRSLSPDYLSRIIDTFANGFLREFAQMSDAIKRRDTTTQISLTKREKAVARHGFEVLLVDDLDPADKDRAEEHADALKFFFRNCTTTHVLEQDQRGGFNLLVRQMMTAVGFRYAVHEIVWKPTVDARTGKPRLTAQFNFVPLQFFEATTGKLRFTPHFFGSIMGEDMEDDAWLVTVGEGIMEAISVMYMFKTMSLKDWVAFSQRFGTPMPHGKTSAPKDSPAWVAMTEAIQAIGNGEAAITSLDAQIALIEAKGGSGALPFEPLVQYADKAIATIARGGDLSTISSGAGAQGRGSSLQGDETDLLEEDDAELISETLKKISRIVIHQLFGDEQPLANISIIVPEKKNNTDTIAKVQALAQAGGKVTLSWYFKELGVPPAPDDTADDQLVRVVTAPATPAPASSFLANAARADVFRAQAAAKLGRAQAEALKPLTDRLGEILGMEDEEEQDAALAKLHADLPKLFRQVNADPQLVAAFEQILGTALISGAAEAAEDQKTKVAANAASYPEIIADRLPPAGKYQGIWSGYNITIVQPGKWVLRTKTGNRGSIPVLVTIGADGTAFSTKSTI